jgi:TatD DNase family protein
VQLASVTPDDFETQEKVRLGAQPGLVTTSVGIHPWMVRDACGTPEKMEQTFSVIEKFLPKAHALGEVGLDFGAKQNPDFIPLQEDVLIRALALAEQYQKPVILHVVHAHPRALELTQNLRVPFMLHSFSGNPTQLKEWLDRGALISFCGNWLRASGYQKVKDSVALVPVDRVLFETDAPDQGWDAQVHTSARVPEIYEAFSSLRKIPLEKLILQVSTNFEKFLAPALPKN